MADMFRSRSREISHWPIWALYAAILAAAPLLFNQDASLSLMSQMGTMMIFALSFNMLLGQGGMLSFGHAVYSGLGAFIAAHALNMAASGVIWMPVSLTPLIGGLAGALFGMLFGYVTTRKSGVTFSMITLGIVELVAACSLMFSGFFGGEAGISTNRVIGNPLLGITYGPQIEVYYLIAFWLFVSTIGMYAFTQTPLGRIINAVRDNPERAEFIGYDVRWARYLTLVFSGFFAGISGGLSTINFEIVTAENVSAVRSGVILLFTIIGGAGFFAGPMIGAIVGVFLTTILSTYTKAWQLYLGVFFMVIVMYAPGGIAGLAMLLLRVVKHGRFGDIWPGLRLVGTFTLLAMLGAVMMIEMLYRLTLDVIHGSTVLLFGLSVDAAAPLSWLAAAALLGVGGAGLWYAKKGFGRRWNEVNAEIESQIQDPVRKSET
jgi:branched-chain amino acid transport system permease protein